MSIDLVTNLWMGGILLFGATFYAVAYVMGGKHAHKEQLKLTKK